MRISTRLPGTEPGGDRRDGDGAGWGETCSDLHPGVGVCTPHKGHSLKIKVPGVLLAELFTNSRENEGYQRNTLQLEVTEFCLFPCREQEGWRKA